jgi:hypothetical protein
MVGPRGATAANLGDLNYYFLYVTYYLVDRRRVYCWDACQHGHAHALGLHRDDIIRHRGFGHRRVNCANLFPTSGRFPISSGRIFYVHHRRNCGRLSGTHGGLAARRIVWKDGSQGFNPGLNGARRISFASFNPRLKRPGPLRATRNCRFLPAIRYGRPIGSNY